MTPTGPLLLNKKFPKWQLESEIWAVPPEGAKGFLETILESNLTGLVLEAHLAQHQGNCRCTDRTSR